MNLPHHHNAFIWRRLGAALSSSFMLALPAAAEDIDIFAGRTVNTDLPNVLIVLDNSANWSSTLDVADCFYLGTNGDGPKADNPGREQGKKMAIEKCALYNVIHELPTGPNGTPLFNLAFMYMNSPNASGAYPKKNFTAMNAAGKDDMKAVITGTSIVNAADQGSNADLARALWEAYLWYKGGEPLYGKAQTNSNRVRYDPLAFLDGKYKSPSAQSCAKNYVILLTNGSPQSTESDIQALLRNAGGNVQQIVHASSYISTSDQNNWAEETARFLNDADVSLKDGMQPIVTYGISVLPANATTSELKYRNYVNEIAKQGGGQAYTASDAETLANALKNIFNSILSVNSVFSAANLPVSVNTQGTFENQIFLGVFKPDGEGLPRWAGNLKQYQFAYDGTTLKLVDSRGTDAVLPNTEFVNPAAVSFWTSPSTFWQNDLLGTPPSSSDSPDGSVVAKGGHAQRLRSVYLNSQASRNVYTCVGCNGATGLTTGASTRFDAGNALITADMLGASNATERTNLINWVRGEDNKGDELGPNDPASGAAITVRPSVHSDVLHSRPAVVNYGGSTGPVVFYGTNDGLLKAVRGKQSGDGAGEELWSFVPEEFLPHLRRQRENLPEVRYHSTPSSVTAPQPRDYFVDGSVTIYKQPDVRSPDGTVVTPGRVFLYATMRRGGRFIYALEVTNPSAPRFLWKKTSADSHLSSMGQTWSEIRVVRLAGRSEPVLLMGGGYDAAGEDCETASCPSVTMGNSVIVLNAVSGDVVKVFDDGIDRPVTGAVSVIDSDRDRLADRGYFADLGGNVYRIDFSRDSSGDNSGDAWSMYKIASLGGKMLFAPDTVAVTTGIDRAVAVMVGSGDREKPWLENSTDRFYVLLDRNMTAGRPAGHEPATLADLTPLSGFANVTRPAGCYLTLEAGEKVISGATTLSGFTFFNTNKPTPPSPNSCRGSLGVARGYALPLVCGTPQVSEFAGGGLPPSPVGGVVNVINSTTGQMEQVPFIISGGGGGSGTISPLEGRGLPTPALEKRKRRYWYIDKAR